MQQPNLISFFADARWTDCGFMHCLPTSDHVGMIIIDLTRVDGRINSKAV